MEYTFQRRMEKLEALKEKYPALETIMETNKVTRRICEMSISHNNDKYHKENFEELEFNLKRFQNMLYGLTAQKIEPSYTIYTNRTIDGKSIVKTGLSILDADELCASVNNEIKVPRGQSLYDMIGALWYVPE